MLHHDNLTATLFESRLMIFNYAEKLKRKRGRVREKKYPYYVPYKIDVNNVCD